MDERRPYRNGRGYATDAEMMYEQMLRMKRMNGGAGPLFPSQTQWDPFSYAKSPFNNVPAPDSFFGKIGDAVLGFLGLTAPGYGGAPTPLFRTSLNMAGNGQSMFSNAMMAMNRGAMNAASLRVSGTLASAFKGAFATDGAGLPGIASRLFGDDVGGMFAGLGSGIQAIEGSGMGAVVMPLINRLLGYDRGAAANMMGGSAGMRIMAGLMQRDSLGDINASGQFGRARENIARNATDIVNRIMYGRWDNDEFTGSYGFTKNDDMYGASEKLIGRIVARNLAEGSFKGSEALINSSSPEEFNRQSTDLVRSFRELAPAVARAVDSLKDFTDGNEDAAASMLELLTGGSGMKNGSVADALRSQVDAIKVSGILSGIDTSVMGQHLSGMANAFTAGRSSIGRGSGLSGQMAVAMTASLMDRLPDGSDPMAQARAMQAMQAYAGANANSRSVGLSTLIERLRESGTIDDNERQKFIDLLTSGNVSDRLDLQKRLSAVMGVSGQRLEAMLADTSLIDTIGNTLSDEGKASAARTNAMAMNREIEAMGGAGVLESRRNRIAGRLVEDGFNAQTVVNASNRGAFREIYSLLNARGTDAAKNASEMIRRQFERNMRATGGDIDRARSMTLGWIESTGMLDDKDLVGEKGREAVSRARNAELENMAATTMSAGNGGLSRVEGIRNGNGSMTVAALGQAVKEMEEFASKFGDTVRGKDGRPVDMRRGVANVRNALARGDYEGARRTMDAILAGVDETSRNMIMKRLGGVTYRTSERIRAETENNREIEEAMADRETSKYFAGVERDEDRMTLARLARQVRSEKDEGEKQNLLKAMETFQQEHRGDARGDMEKLMRAVEEGKVEDALAVFKNGNISEADFRSAMESLGKAGLAATSVNEVALRRNMSAAAKTENEADRLRKGTELLGGDAGRASFETIAGLVGKDADNKDLRNYLSIISGKEVGDDEVSAFVKAEGGGKSLFDTVNDRKASAEDRQAAAVEILNRKKSFLESQKAALTGKGELSGDERERLKAVESAIGSTTSQIEHVVGMSADSFASLTDQRLDIRDDRKAGGSGFSGEDLMNELLRKIGELIEKLMSYIGRSGNGG